MDYKTARHAMQGYFNTGWASATPIVWGNDSTYEPEEGTSWVRFNITHSAGFQSTMGDPSNNRFERQGIITVQIFSPQGEYGETASDLATNALKLYEGTVDNGIYYFDAYANDIGNDGNGWHQVNVLTSFRYNEIT